MIIVADSGNWSADIPSLTTSLRGLSLIHILSRWYVERCGASPEGAADIPDAELRTELLGLFGIGGETADDLMLYVFSRCV